jgi:hypothetical protein
MRAGAVDRSVTERVRQDLLSRRPGNASVIIRDATHAMSPGSQVEDSLEGIRGSFRGTARHRYVAGREGEIPAPNPERPVKPSASPTMVRTHHLPLPAETARDREILRVRGPSRVVSSLCHRWSGDVIPPRWLRTYSGRIRGGRERFAEPFAPRFRWPTVVSEQPGSPPEDR